MERYIRFCICDLEIGLAALITIRNSIGWTNPENYPQINYYKWIKNQIRNVEDLATSCQFHNLAPDFLGDLEIEETWKIINELLKDEVIVHDIWLPKLDLCIEEFKKIILKYHHTPYDMICNRYRDMSQDEKDDCDILLLTAPLYNLEDNIMELIHDITKIILDKDLKGLQNLNIDNFGDIMCYWICTHHCLELNYYSFASSTGEGVRNNPAMGGYDEIGIRNFTEFINYGKERIFADKGYVKQFLEGQSIDKKLIYNHLAGIIFALVRTRASELYTNTLT
jgi:hypothetical protein